MHRVCGAFCPIIASHISLPKVGVCEGGFLHSKKGHKEKAGKMIPIKTCELKIRSPFLKIILFWKPDVNKILDPLPLFIPGTYFTVRGDVVWKQEKTWGVFL